MLPFIALILLSANEGAGPDGPARCRTDTSLGATPAAWVRDQPICESAITPDTQSRLLAIKTEEYNIKKRALQRVIEATLMQQEAERRGVTAAQLELEEVDAKVGKVT